MSCSPASLIGMSIVLYSRFIKLIPSASLLISSEYEPYSIIERLDPYLAGSASIVVHSPYSQVCFCVHLNDGLLETNFQIIVDLQAQLRNFPQYLCPTITEAWLRRYQVR